MGRVYARHLRLSRRDARPRNIAVTKSLDRDRAIRVQDFGMAQNMGETNVQPAAKHGHRPRFRTSLPLRSVRRPRGRPRAATDTCPVVGQAALTP